MTNTDAMQLKNKVLVADKKAGIEEHTAQNIAAWAV